MKVNWLGQRRQEWGRQPPLILTDEDFSPQPCTARRGLLHACEFISMRGQWRFTGLTADWARYRAYQGMQPWGQKEIRERQAARQYGD